jgi:hypothetical protein
MNRLNPGLKLSAIRLSHARQSTAVAAGPDVRAVAHRSRRLASAPFGDGIMRMYPMEGFMSRTE